MSETDVLAAATGFAVGFATEPDGDRSAALARLGASGLPGITVPALHGGPQCSVVTLAEVQRTLARADPDLARILHGHHLFLRALAEQGIPDQQAYFFGQALAGTCFAGIGVEGFGDAPIPVTLCRWRNGVYRLDGETRCGPDVLLADWLVVRAVLVDELAEESDESDEVLAVIRRDDLGVTVEGGAAAPSSTGTIWFDGVRVAVARVVPYSTLFDRPTTFTERARVTGAALDGASGAELREAARAVDRAELDTPMAEQYTGM